ncbi:unnamed protein product [Somion occarium]|uniref:Major facilitator superfamily (MFS) profile domain-containing protein n=1 Tax=Somion occarium TaxID=3059160 RepID=A0ABP1CU76_9APHY
MACCTGLLYILCRNGRLGAWGVFQDYYSEHTLAGTSETVLSLLGSMPGLIMTIFSVVTGKLGDRYGYKPFLAVGAVFWVASMVGTAFSTKLWHFFITQGILQGTACALVFPLIVALPGQWFLKRRAFAIGIIVAGSSLGGAIGSLILRAMLSALGLRRAMAIYACIDATMLSIAFLLIKERHLPSLPGSVSKKIVWFDRTFLVDPVFWSLGICLLLCIFGYLPPIFYLATFTKAKVPNVTQLNSALPVTILNLSAAVGRTIIGFIADRMGFAVLYGFFCGCAISLSPAVAARLYGPGRLAGLSGLLLLFNIPGNGAGAPVSGAVLRATNNNWTLVAILNGGCQVAGAICLLYARFKRAPKILAVY